MKKLFFIVPIIALALAVPARAQVTNTPGGSFFSSVTSYFTSFDTNSTTFGTNCHAEVWTGVDSTPDNLDSSLGLEYHVWKNLTLESVTRNAGGAGVIKSQQLGVGLTFNLYDVEIGGYVDGGYSFEHSRAMIAAGFRAKKALTTHTFMGVGIETQFSSKTPGRPILSALIGFVF